MNVYSLLEQFCENYYIKKDIGATAALLTDNIYWLTSPDNLTLCGIDEVKNYMSAAVAVVPAGIKLELWERYFCRADGVCGTGGDPGTAGTAGARLRLSTGEASLTCRLTVSAVDGVSGARLCFIQMSDTQTEGWFPHLHSENSDTPYETLIKNLSCGFTVFHQSQSGTPVVMYQNDGFFEMSGMRRPEDGDFELFHRRYSAGIHQDDVRSYLDALNDTLTNHKNCELTYRYTVPGGMLKWITAVIRNTEHRDGTCDIFTTYFDITEQMVTQKRFYNVIHTVPCGICLYSWDGVSLEPLIVNRRFSEMLGEEAQPYLKASNHLNYTHVHPDDLPGLTAASLEALHKTHKIDYTYRSLNLKTKEYIWVHMRGVMISQDDGCSYAYISYYDVTQEHNNEMKLRESEQALEYATNHAGLWYWRYYPSLDRAYLDTRNQQTLNLPEVLENYPESFLARGIIHRDYVGVYADAFKRIKNGEREASFEVQAYLSEGALNWARISLTRLTNESGRSDVCVCTGMIIDTEKELYTKYELERKKSSIEDDRLIAHAVFNLTTGKTVEFSYSNGTPVPPSDRLGFSEQENNNHDRLIIDEGERARYRALCYTENLLACYARGETEFAIEYRRLMPDGSIRWVRNTQHTVRDPESSDILLFEYRYNIENEKMNELMYHSLTFENYDYIIRVEEKNGSFVSFIRAGLSYKVPPLSGSDLDACIDDLYGDSVAMPDRETVAQSVTVAKMSERLAAQERCQFTYREIQPDGGMLYKKITQYYLDAERHIILITKEDITPIVRVEMEKNDILANALEAANQASRAKSQFLSRMSHELRTPMNAIIGLSALAAGDINNPSAMEDAISKIGISARYLLSLVNDILEMSRIESGRMTLSETYFDTERLISSVNAIIFEQATAKGLDYDAVVNGFLESGYIGDETKLQQILVNILGNSVKFTPAGGKVTLAVEQIRHNTKNATLRFTVSDTGVGIEPEFIPHIFDAFSQESQSFTSPSTGTGLGLAITKSMVEMMSGQIKVQSIKNVGSVFTVEVQLGVSEQSRNSQELISSMNLSRLHALVVDDDVIVCQTTENILSAMGLRAEWVDSGLRAVERVRQLSSAKDNFDMIFIDWKMPDMDGIETARQIRRIVGPDITIIIMTAYDWRTIEAQAREAGVDMFMEKPLFQSSIISAFEKIFSVHKEKIMQPQKEEYNFSGKNILLAEDHPLNVEVAKRMLEKVGASVTVAANGLEALEAFTTADNYHYDAILMDVRMPVMDGLTAARNIRNLKKEGSKTIPIIAMTANAFDEDVELSMSHGMDAHIIKPIDPQLLFAAMKKSMKKQEIIKIYE